MWITAIGVRDKANKSLQNTSTMQPCRSCNHVVHATMLFKLGQNLYGPSEAGDTHAKMVEWNRRQRRGRCKGDIRLRALDINRGKGDIPLVVNNSIFQGKTEGNGTNGRHTPCLSARTNNTHALPPPPHPHSLGTCMYNKTLQRSSKYQYQSLVLGQLPPSTSHFE